MSYYNCESVTMTKAKANSMIKWFDEHIGTDRELNKDDADSFYIVFFEMRWKEFNKLAAHHKAKTGGNVTLL